MKRKTKKIVIAFLLLAVFFSIMSLCTKREEIILTNLTKHSAFDAYPSVSPDGSKVAFISNRDGNYELYVMDRDGGDQKRLTNNSVDEKSPSWSPDGKEIIFVSRRGGYDEIFKIDLQSLEQQKIFGYEFGDVVDPALSPDDSMIAFSCPDLSGKDTGFDIYRMDFHQGTPINLSATPGTDNQPSWSPCAKKLLFVSERDENWEIYSMNTDGTYQTNLSKNHAEDAGPCWSPDGNKIAFVSTRDGNHEIYIMDSDGTNQKRLTDHPAKDLWPSWMPDNSGIVFYSRRDGNGEIYKMEFRKGWCGFLKDWWKKLGAWSSSIVRRDTVELHRKDAVKGSRESPEKAELRIDIFKEGFRYIPQGFPYGKSVKETRFLLYAAPKEKLVREPKYHSDSPLYGSLTLGNSSDNIITCVVDHKENAEALLYIDSNNNEDLTDDKGPVSNEGKGKLACSAEVMVQYETAGEEYVRPYKVWVFFSEDENGNITGGGFYPRCYYEGFVQLGGIQYTAFIFDRNPDGLYSDEGIYIDVDKNNLFSEKTEYFHEGDIFSVGEKTYKIAQLNPSKKPVLDLKVHIRIGTSVMDREILGEGSSFPSSVGKVYCWSQVNGGTRTTWIEHLWIYNGKTITTARLPVRSISHRTWSYKTILPSFKGTWRVEVRDEGGNLLGEKGFEIRE